MKNINIIPNFKFCSLYGFINESFGSCKMNALATFSVVFAFGPFFNVFFGNCSTKIA